MFNETFILIQIKFTQATCLNSPTRYFHARESLFLRAALQIPIIVHTHVDMCTHKHEHIHIHNCDIRIFVSFFSFFFKTSTHVSNELTKINY